MNTESETVPCRLCGTPTRMKGTRLCDPCYELESRIHTMETLPIPRTTLSQLVDAFNKAKADIDLAFALLKGVEQALSFAFGDKAYPHFDISYLIRYHHLDLDKPDQAVALVKLDVWKALVDRMDLRRILPSSRMEELEKQLKDPKLLPDITVANLFSMLEQMHAQIPQYMEESVKETFEYLRSRRSKYKTNSEFEVGPKVIVPSALRDYYGRTFGVSHWHDQDITALDNTFHVLDGKGTVKTNRGPLYDAIEQATPEQSTGETDYFRFKCFKNRNLHLEFKRADLVAKLNQIAGGMRLKK